MPSHGEDSLTGGSTPPREALLAALPLEDPGALVGFLQRLPVFAGLSAGELAALAEVGAVQRFRARQPIRREASTERALHILLRGQAKVVMHVTAAETKTIALLGSGEPIGFVSLYLDGAASAEVVTTRESLVLSFSGESLDALFEAQPALATKLLRRLLAESGRWIRHLDSQIADIARLYVRERPATRECPVFKRCLLTLPGAQEPAQLGEVWGGMAERVQVVMESLMAMSAELRVLRSVTAPVSAGIHIEDLKVSLLSGLMEALGAAWTCLYSPAEHRDGWEALIKRRGEARIERQIIPAGGTTSVSPDPMGAAVHRWASGALPVAEAREGVICIPLRGARGSVGLIVAGQTGGLDTGRSTLRMFDVLGDWMATAFENTRLHTLAITDELTHLYTRRHFHDQIAALLAQSDAANPFALVLIDLDHFKRINDTLGHLAGDRVLREAAELIHRELRVGDTGYRYGGEEFAVLLPGANAATALAFADRVRSRVANYVFPVGDDPRIPVTVSVGVAVCPAHALTVEGLIAAADASLYEAKAGGRDRVVAAKLAQTDSTAEDLARG